MDIHNLNTDRQKDRQRKNNTSLQPLQSVIIILGIVTIVVLLLLPSSAV